jgi:MinD-like ATPase involved in chromosome partitioning or flagellar assembly
MTTEVLVTVVGTRRRGEVSLDNTVPVSTLVADLTRHYGSPQEASDVVLADDHGAVLDPDGSLEQAGITHGSALHLRARPAEPSLPDVRHDPAKLNPLDNTRHILPARHRTPRRIRRSLAAAIGRNDGDPHAIRTVGYHIPSPGELTLPAAPGPMARFKREWENTDYVHRLDLAITGPQLSRCATMAIVSPKGGVGKTTTTALLGTLVAHLRRDLVIAVDANPDYGSLGRVLCPNDAFFVDDLGGYLATTPPPGPSLADLNARLGAGPHGLRVLPAPTDHSRMRHIGLEVYRDIIERLKAYAGLLLLDCGTGLHEPAATAALDAADQIIVVSDAEPATASLVAEAICRIRLTAPLTLVVNKVPARGVRLDLRRLADTLATVDHLVVIPTDVKTAATLGVGAFSWERTPLGWQHSIRELAAVLIGSWTHLGLDRQSHSRRGPDSRDRPIPLVSG